MEQTIRNTNFNFPKQESVYHGKVRDVYSIKGGLVVMIASDRISAFDHVLPEGIPYKGQVLNQIASLFLEATKDIVPNWLLTSPDPSVSIGLKCEPIRIEMVIRGYLAGHAAREYQLGKREVCGVKLPDGLKENDRFSSPIITPTLKADAGHDEDISKEAIISNSYVSKEVYEKLESYTYALFQRGSEMAKERGLLLVDTKYEFGLRNGEIFLIDEIHTPDSSRYFYAEGYEERQANGDNQKQLSKEFVRQWLIENGFQGKEGQVIPDMPEDFVRLVSERYIELFEKISGVKFVKADNVDIEKRIEKNVNSFLTSL
jgi:phosphoribosylaminoimidazole-succinocarboxamide synthase